MRASEFVPMLRWDFDLNESLANQEFFFEFKVWFFLENSEFLCATSKICGWDWKIRENTLALHGLGFEN